MKKNSLISVVIVLLACAFSVTTNNAQSSKCDSIGPRIVEVSLGYRMSEVGYVENLLPTLDVAFQVALPILKQRMKQILKGICLLRDILQMTLSGLFMEVRQGLLTEDIKRVDFLILS